MTIDDHQSIKQQLFECKNEQDLRNWWDKHMLEVGSLCMTDHTHMKLLDINGTFASHLKNYIIPNLHKQLMNQISSRELGCLNTQDTALGRKDVLRIWILGEKP